MAALVDVQSDSISTGAVHNSTLRPFFYLVTLSVEVRETFRDAIFFTISPQPSSTNYTTKILHAYHLMT